VSTLAFRRRNLSREIKREISSRNSSRAGDENTSLAPILPLRSLNYVREGEPPNGSCFSSPNKTSHEITRSRTNQTRSASCDSMKAGRVKVEVRLIVSPFYPSCRQHADKWCFFWRAHSTVRSRSFFVSSSGLNHTTELGLMSIITNSQPSPWNHGPCSVPTY